MIKYLSVPLLLVGCATPGVDRVEENQLVQEFYATITAVKPVTLSSEVGTGTLVGATVGALEEADGNTEDIIAGGIAGALVGGLFTAMVEGSDEAIQYSLYNNKRGDFTLVQKESVAKDGNCVRVRVADKATITPVNSKFCQV